MCSYEHITETIPGWSALSFNTDEESGPGKDTGRPQRWTHTNWFSQICGPICSASSGTEVDSDSQKYLFVLTANLVLHRTIERIYVGKQYGDIPRGIFVVRGENVELLGEIDLKNEGNLPLEEVSVENILQAQRLEQQKKQDEQKKV
ncbi:putative U6 snRNA-associated Sm-like protein LSm1-like [Apostichopus japonicus]|uniref:Putative U6 snRNA-associated Sm-like protein LSm1-like n=1 Tax=Stichopus japonicus TaxID=307972 RepID=A0A2G8LH91_STIJA|nr:putative U6 snRNA-associated Sm-like protein LSm1-like [Apostichopus japonicus]